MMTQEEKIVFVRGDEMKIWLRCFNCGCDLLSYGGDSPGPKYCKPCWLICTK